PSFKGAADMRNVLSGVVIATFILVMSTVPAIASNGRAHQSAGASTLDRSAGAAKLAHVSQDLISQDLISQDFVAVGGDSAIFLDWPSSGTFRRPWAVQYRHRDGATGPWGEYTPVRFRDPKAHSFTIPNLMNKDSYQVRYAYITPWMFCTS